MDGEDLLLAVVRAGGVVVVVGEEARAVDEEEVDVVHLDDAIVWLLFSLVALKFYTNSFSPCLLRHHWDG